MKSHRLLLVALLALMAALVSPETRAQTATPRNVVFILTDDQDFLSLPVMRHLMSFPYGSWVHFSNSVTNVALCGPSRITHLTGQEARSHGFGCNNNLKNFDDSNTLATWLDGAGYHTGIVGKYINGFPWGCKSNCTPDGWDYAMIKEKALADWISPQATSFIASAPTPFYLWLGVHDPHYPASPPARYANAEVYLPPKSPNVNEADVSDKPRWVRELPGFGDKKYRKWGVIERTNGQRALLAVDDLVLAVIEALAARGELDNTLIIFTSDNGFSYGSHRWLRKSCGYQECNQVPLLVRLPGLQGNRTETAAVSNASVAPTIAAWAGVTPGLEVDGPSLIPLLDGSVTTEAWPDGILIEKYKDSRTPWAFFGVRAQEWTYIENHDGFIELYDLAGDPYQLQNVAGQAAYADIQALLDARLDELLSD